MFFSTKFTHHSYPALRYESYQPDYIGQKWQEFQQKRYNQGAQPYYVITDTEGNTINKPIAYEPNIDKYKHWLLSGLEEFKKK